MSSFSAAKDEATSELERLRPSVAHQNNAILEERKARQLLADENFAMQLTLKDSNKEKARIAAKNISLKEKFRKNRALLKLAADTISDAKQRVSQFLNTTFGEIVPNSYKEALMLAYADSIE